MIDLELQGPLRLIFLFGEMKSFSLGKMVLMAVKMRMRAFVARITLKEIYQTRASGLLGAQATFF